MGRAGVTTTGALRWTESELISLVRDYRRIWWQAVPSLAARVRADPTLLSRAQAGGLTTLDAYSDGDLWAPDRQVVHAALITAQIGVGPRPDVPTAYFTIGAIGAGKTTALRPLVLAHRQLHGAGGASSLSRIAADEIREALPEFADGLGNDVVAQECYLVTYDGVFPVALESGQDVIYDTIGTLLPTGDPALVANLRRLRGAGYRVQVLLAEAPLPECVARAKQRALSANGRLISASQQTDMHGQAARTLEWLLAEPDLLDGWAVLDTYSEGLHGPILRGSDDWMDEHPALRGQLLGNP